jgi:hypothetical protein
MIRQGGKRGREKDCGGEGMIPLFVKRRRKNLIERLNNAIEKYSHITVKEWSIIQRKVRPFLKDDEIKSLYDTLKIKLGEDDNQTWDNILTSLNSEKFNVLKEWEHKWENSPPLTQYGKAVEIAATKPINFVDEELESWSQVFPVTVINEIQNSMTLAEVLEAVEYFKNKYKNTNYGKEYELYVEGDTDIRYLLKAAELFGKGHLLDKFEITDAEGAPNLDKVYNGATEKLAKARPRKTILLYDCDTAKKNTNKGKIYRRTIPQIPDNPIHAGIENLFRKSVLDKAREFKPAFIDVTHATSKIERGQQVIIPEVWEVNKDEKKNLCNWIVQNGTKEDYEIFSLIFDLLSKIENIL